MDYLFIDEGRVRIKNSQYEKISSKAPVFIILPWNLTETYQWLLYQCTVKVVSRILPSVMPSQVVAYEA